MVGVDSAELMCADLFRRRSRTSPYGCKIVELLIRHFHCFLNSIEEIVTFFVFEMDQPKRRSAQQARHKQIGFAYYAASARLRPTS